MTDRERDAQTIIAVSRQYQSRCCAEPLPEHLAIELAAICVDATTTITEQTKAEARAILESERES